MIHVILIQYSGENNSAVNNCIINVNCRLECIRTSYFSDTLVDPFRFYCFLQRNIVRNVTHLQTSSLFSRVK